NQNCRSMIVSSIKQVLIFVAFLSFSGCSRYLFQDELPKILGLSHIQVVDRERIEEWGGLKGEGYVFETFILSDTTVNAIGNIENKDIPLKNGWKQRNWRSTPIEAIDSEAVILALSYWSSNSKLNM